jgi:hypothetical protein
LKYIDEDLAKMNEFVEGYPLYITPFILKLKINIFHLDSNFKPISFHFEPDLKISENISPTINSNYLPDLSLIFHNCEINVFFRSLHYDTFYKRNFIDKMLDLYKNSECIIIEGQMNQKEYNDYKLTVISQAKKAKLLSNPITKILDSESLKVNPAGMTNIVIDLNNVNLENSKHVVLREEKKESQNKTKNEVKKLMKACKACETKTKFIQLSDKCEVCFDCQKRAMTKSNKFKDAKIVKKKCVDRCISCKNYLKPQDYDLILNIK